MAAYDSGDRAYVFGTIREAEAAQLKFFELSQRALIEDSKFVSAERTLWLASVRLYDIYCNLDQDAEAERFLRESYHYRGDEESALTFVEYRIRIREFIDAMGPETFPQWKDSNRVPGAD